MTTKSIHANTEKTLTRDVEAIQIPSGVPLPLKAGTQVYITQALGGSFTIATSHGLARITEQDVDALGIDVAEKAVADADGKPILVEEKTVWDALKTCYDPEIPVNIVDLGLVYDCRIEKQENAGAKIEVKMTLTAPGCGMGPAICAEARGKLMAIPGVADASVDLVWDPAWSQSMISEIGLMKLGMI